MAKQLSLSERITIERMLHGDYTFATIGRRLNRSASTISREIQSYRFFVHPVPEKGRNDCLKFHSCIRNSCCPYTESVHGCLTYRCKRCPDHNCIEFCTAYESSHCPLLDKPPYVCTGCTNELQKKCKKNHAYYTAHRADHAHHKAIKLAHSGIRKTPEELVEIGRLIKPLILNGQSLNHICTTHAKTLGVSEKTLYNYIDQGVFSVRNIDLPKKVVYRKRRERKVLTKMEYRYRKGRTIEDFNSFLEANPDVSVVEMDTVKGKREKSKVLLTMIFRKSSFLLIFLLPDATQKSILWYSTYNSFSLFFHLSAAFFKVNNCVNVDVQKNGPSAVSRYCQAGRITFPRPACQQSPVPTGCGLPAVFQSVSFVPSLPPAAKNQA
jgi:IS30 family transposase